MKSLLLIAILNIGHSSCGNEPKIESKTINNDTELATILDSVAVVQTQVKDTLVVQSDTKNQKTYSNDSIKSVATVPFQDDIDNAINSAFSTGSLSPIQDKIKEIEADKSIPHSYKNYWKTYLLYYKAIGTKNILKNDDKASDAIDKAIESAEHNLKTSEDYALYAACISYSVQFANMTKISNISAKANESANKALELNPQNVRAYYVLTSQNFYTPKMFGGMTKVEEYGIKGIACPLSIDDSKYKPTWSKELIYEILVKFYQTENRNEDVEKIKKLANQEFPGLIK